LNKKFTNTNIPIEAKFNSIWTIQQTLIKYPHTEKFIKFILDYFDFTIEFANSNYLKEHTNNNRAYYPKQKILLYTIVITPE